MHHLDLHTHTHYSDGKYSPAEVIQAAAQAGIRTLAITDHDNCNGVREAAPFAEAAGIALVPAAEFTTCWPEAGLPRADADVDLLGYFIDLDHPGLRAFETAALADVHSRIAESCAALTASGFPLSMEEVFAQNPRYGGAVQAIHALQHKGYAPDWAAAVDLFNSAWLSGRIGSFTIQTVIEQIHQVGGAAVLAHPAIVRPEGQQINSRWLRHLVDAGLDGIEVYHWRLDEAARALFLGLAREFGLVITGGSDMHGWFHGLEGMGQQPVTQEMLENLRAKAQAAA